MTVVPIRPTDPALDTVADLISALIRSGDYSPSVHGIHSDDIWSHKKVHQFCLEYQERTNTAPSPEYLMRRFPDFPFNTEANLSWATHEFNRENSSRRLRSVLIEVNRGLIDEDPERSWQALRDGIDKAPLLDDMMPTPLTEVGFYDQEKAPACPVAGATLQKITGGIRPGHLWYVAARPGMGKSQDLISHAVTAITHGWNVAFFSLEMPNEDVLSILHRRITGGENDIPKRIEKIKKWTSDPAHGHLQVYPHMNLDSIGRVAAPETLVLIDYVSLIHMKSSVRDRYQRMAEVGDGLRMAAKKHNVPIIAAAQLNRESERRRRPSLADLAEADQIGRGADVAYFILGETGSAVRRHQITKNRHGEAGCHWFVHFQPGIGRFDEISESRANDLASAEDN